MRDDSSPKVTPRPPDQGAVVDDRGATSPRPLFGVVEAVEQTEGAGFVVRRPFPQQGLEMLDPFLLLDEMVPTTYGPGEATGAPDHPHRGFETVTYLLRGSVDHADSKGNHGHIEAGGVQWMRAGAGIVHREMPSASIQTDGGTVHGFQLWVNLPAADKLSPPRYQSLSADQIPTATGPGWSAAVIAGEIGAVTGPAVTHSAITYAHLHVDAGATCTLDLPADHNVGLYVFAGAAAVHTLDAKLTVRAQSLAIFQPKVGPVTFDGAADALLVAGQPLNEPVVRYGPFVMNTRDEIMAAFEDFEAGRMGHIDASGRAGA